MVKIVRDAIFLSQHSTAELPYVYLFSGFLAGISIGGYGHYVSGKALHQLLNRSLIFITLSVFVFWYMLSSHDAGWLHYAFYIWSSIVFMVTVAQVWTFAEDVFTAREGKRLFGTVTTGGTLGGIVGAFLARWLLGLNFGTVQLLGLVAVLLLGAFAVCRFANDQSNRLLTVSQAPPNLNQIPAERKGIFELLRHSPHLQLLGALIFISVIVSTLLDFQFKVAAKETYASADELANFFASYYGWLSIFTLIAGFALTGQLVALIGLYPSLIILPAVLLIGSLGFLVFPGFLLATILRMGDASLRPTFYRSLTEMLYFPIPTAIKTRVKTFLDVVVERLGDGSAGFLILLFSLTGTTNYPALVYCCMALLALWIMLLPSLHRGYLAALLSAMTTRQLDFAADDIDYPDNATVEVVTKVLQSDADAPLLIGLEFAEKLDPEVILSRLPRGLLRHPSPAVQARMLKLLSGYPDRKAVDEYLTRIANEEVGASTIRHALVDQANRQDPRQITDAVREFFSAPTKRQAHDKVVEFGEAAVEPLKAALFDAALAREARLNIPTMLSRIESQVAMDALFTALEHEDGGTRYKVFLALEEMARRFPNLRLDRGAIENAIVADTVRFYKRFVSYHVLFSDWREPPLEGAWLLRQALLDSMARVKERALYLLSLIYPRNEIGPAFAALQSSDPVTKAYAIELLDNRLTGRVKRHLFPLFDDTPAARQNQKFLGLLGWEGFTAEAAINGLLQQEDAILAAATVWEIGLRGITGFEENLQALANSDDTIRKETAELVLLGDAFAPTR